MNQRTADFREAMSRWATTVSVVTTSGDAGMCGITVSAVCPVTDSPPTVAVCINRASYANAACKRNAKLAINVLSHEQTQLARIFSGQTAHEAAARFDDVDWLPGQLQQPILSGVVAWMEGVIEGWHEIGSHTLFGVGIKQCNVGDAKAPIIYYRRRYRIMQSDSTDDYGSSA